MSAVGVFDDGATLWRGTIVVIKTTSTQLKTKIMRNKFTVSLGSSAQGVYSVSGAKSKGNIKQYIGGKNGEGK